MIFFFCTDLTSHKYLWLVTQSVIGDPEDRSTMRMSLPIGMLGENKLTLKLYLKNDRMFFFQEFTLMLRWREFFRVLCLSDLESFFMLWIV